MSAPIPSFFKIRLALIVVLLFLVFFFFVGLNRNVFANPPNTGSYFSQSDGFSYTVILVTDTGTKAQEACVADNNGNSCGVSSRIHGAMYLNDPMGWIDWYHFLRTEPNNQYKIYIFHPSYVPPEPPCGDERNILSEKCGGEGTYYINEETCKGHCTPTPDCAAKYEQKVVQCGDANKIKDWDNITCTGQCETEPLNRPSNLGPPDNC